MKSGDRIREYILEREIGDGVSGEVWLARNTLLDRKAAIREVWEWIGVDPATFLTGSRDLAQLRHPNIVELREYFTLGKRCFLVMAFVEGHSLGDRLLSAGNPLHVDEALAVSRDILLALNYAHQKGIIHRDIRPRNILINSGGKAHLADTGVTHLVRFMPDRKLRWEGLGNCLSPEMISRPKQVDHRSDIYSFGCILFEMLCGHPPFTGKEEASDFQDEYKILQGHVMKAPPWPRELNPSVPCSIEAAILKALEKEPEKRFQTCGEFLAALECVGPTRS